MSYQFFIDTDPKAFDEFVINSDQNSLLQCSNWAKIKNNWDHLLTSVKDGDKIVGTALVLIRNLPLGLTLFYIPKGPVMDYSNKELVSFYMNELKKIAKKKKAIEICFDPIVLSRKYSYKDKNKDNPYLNNDVIEYLKSLGIKHKGFTLNINETIQPRFNAEVEVSEDYFDKLPHKTIKRWESAIHKGNVMYEGKEYLKDFATAMHYTEVRKQVGLRNEEYFANMANVYGDKCIIMVTKLNFKNAIKNLEDTINENKEKLNDPAYGKNRRAAVSQDIENDSKELEKLKEDYKREGTDEVITCGTLAVYNDNLMEIFYMGNHTDYLRTFASYLLYGKCIERCKQLGIKTCSFGGVEGTLNDGLTAFKSNWNMNVEEYIGEFNYVLNPFMYMMMNNVYPFIKKIGIKIKSK